MVKRFVSFLFLFVFLLTLFVCSVFAVDVIQSDSDLFGFSYDDSKIVLFDHNLSGSELSVSNQLVDADRFYIYIPYFRPAESLDISFSFLTLDGYQSIKLTGADIGLIYSNSYHYSKALDLPVLTWVGTSSVSGSSAIRMNLSISISDLGISNSYDNRYIRLTFDPNTPYSTSFRLVSFLQSRLDQGLSGVLGNPTYSFSGTNDSHFVNYFSGSFETDPVYIQGQLKSQYWDGSAVKVFSGSLLNSTSGSGGYLRIPKLSIHAADPSANSMKFHALASDVTGTLTPSSASQDTDLQGTYLSRYYVNSVSLSATRSYSDQELIQAVNDASDRNHTDITNFYNRNHSDLQAISSQLGELVDHQDQVNQTGDNIGSTTSASSISDTSSSLSSGSNSLSGVLSTASDISSVSGAAAPYISFIGAAMPIILNFGNGVLAWAVVGIIACSVFLWILKKVAE